LRFYTPIAERQKDKIRSAAFTGRSMTQVAEIKVRMSAMGSRISRLPFVLLLTVGLLLSLLHCAGCGLAFANADSTAVAMNIDPGSAPDTPEQQLPCHGGHCLSHVTAQQAAVVAMPADLVVRPLAFGREKVPAALAGLPPFKPPRA
jgi:hypothetical protein